MSPVTGNADCHRLPEIRPQCQGGAQAATIVIMSMGIRRTGAIPPLPNDLVCVTCHTNTVPMSTQGHIFQTFPPPTLACRLRDSPTPSLTRPPEIRSRPAVTAAITLMTRPRLLRLTISGRSRPTATLKLKHSMRQAFIKNTTCNRCHSATGYRYYVTNSQASITTALLGRYSSAKEVVSLFCLPHQLQLEAAPHRSGRNELYQLLHPVSEIRQCHQENPREQFPDSRHR